VRILEKYRRDDSYEVLNEKERISYTQRIFKYKARVVKNPEVRAKVNKLGYDDDIDIEDDGK